MKAEAMVMTIDFGNNHFNAIYLNNELKLIASNGSMIAIADTTHNICRDESKGISSNFLNFLSIVNIDKVKRKIDDFI